MLNAAPFLGEALESVLAQTTTDTWELILVDDGSEDGSLAVAQRFRQRFGERLLVLGHPGGANRGTSASRNLALAHARGRTTAFLDADDVWLPHMLEEQLALLQQHPTAAMVYANAERTWEMDKACAGQNGPLGVNELPALLPSGVQPGLLPPPAALQWFLEEEALAPCTCTVLLRTAVLRALGGFEECFQGLYDDQALYAKVMLTHPVAVSTHCVARYRRHYTSCCAKVWHNKPAQDHARRHFRDWLKGYTASLPEVQCHTLTAV